LNQWLSYARAQPAVLALKLTGLRSKTAQ
jgi:hypothetical protein